MLRRALKALGLWDKSQTHGEEIVFTLDYTHYCKKRGHVLTGAKIVDCDTRNPKDGTFLIEDRENAQGNDELTCILLHFVNAKESHASCMANLKPFFDFGNRCLNIGLLSRNNFEPAFVPFNLCAFPMDRLAEQKCLNTGVDVN